MKTLIILIMVVLSLNALAMTTIQLDSKILTATYENEEPQSVVLEHFLVKPAIDRSSLFQVASWQSCRQECLYDFDLCIQNGFHRSVCRIDYFECLSQNCP